MITERPFIHWAFVFTSCYAATSPDLEGHGGLYLEDCHVAERNDDPSSVSGVRSYALDPESADRLWSLTEGLVGERFYEPRGEGHEAAFKARLEEFRDLRARVAADRASGD